MSGRFAEIALDESLIVDAAVDYWRGVDPVIENDGHLPMHILLGEWPEATGAFRRQSKVDLPLAGIVRVAGFRRASQVATGHYRRAAEDVPDLSGVLRRIAAIRAAGHKLRPRRQNAAMRRQCRSLRWIRAWVFDQPQLQLPTRLNHSLRAGRIAFPRKLP